MGSVFVFQCYVELANWASAKLIGGNKTFEMLCRWFRRNVVGGALGRAPRLDRRKFGDVPTTEHINHWLLLLVDKKKNVIGRARTRLVAIMWLVTESLLASAILCGENGSHQGSNS